MCVWMYVRVCVCVCCHMARLHSPLPAGELLCMCWNVAELPLHPLHPPPLSTTHHHPSSSQSASQTAPSLRHLHISSSLGQSIKLNPCLG